MPMNELLGILIAIIVIWVVLKLAKVAIRLILCIAVSTPEGLITPVVRNGDSKSVTDISNEVRVLADKAKNRKLTPNDYQGSTFTISNLGAEYLRTLRSYIEQPVRLIL
jgi:pyruvate dehydrogenase E2 component (dihydrolipoamide acetyltransferase)